MRCRAPLGPTACWIGVCETTVINLQEKHTVKHARAIYTFILVSLGSLLLAGCASFQGNREPVTVPEIVQMSQDKVPAYEIIERMGKSGTTYRLSAAQLANLRQEGVPDPVINYMQRTYIEAVRREQSLEDWDHWTDVDGWWYGGRPYGWQDDWVM
jgi:hypothetical protein